LKCRRHLKNYNKNNIFSVAGGKTNADGNGAAGDELQIMIRKINPYIED